ncbi:MAG: serine/threonine-protein kinase [Phycisphaerales bacterium]
MRHTTEHDLLESYHASGRMDTEGFFSFLSSVRAAADEQIAHLIDWRSRSGLDGPYEIDAFLTSIPNLRNRPVVLDAVIDVVLRSHARGVGDSERAITDLRTKHPDLCDAIDAAVVLGSLVGTTRMSSSEIPERTLPEEIGLPTPEGRSRYVLRERMGAGANGRVYLAEDRLLSSEGKPVFVAVKFLSRLGGSTLADRVAAAEAIKARRVRHTNVASALDRGVTSDGASYVVFEHVAGGNLHGHIRGADHRLSPRAAATLVRDIARGTQAIHSAGLLHCDLKPSNVLMEIDGTPRITDFGLAQWEGEVRDLPSMVELGGTLGFGAPEQFAPGSVLNTATDTYALGGLLLWCLRGVAPNGSSAEEARRNLDSANVRTIRTRAAAGGAWAGAESERDRSGATTTTNTLSPSAIAEIDNALLAAICARALSCDPTRRYQSAEALANDLERVLRDEGLVWAKEDPAARLTRWVRRERAAAALAAALILVASAGTALVLTQSKKALIAEHQREVADLRAERVNATISQARSTLADSLLMTRASYGNRVADSGHDPADTHGSNLRSVDARGEGSLEQPNRRGTPERRGRTIRRSNWGRRTPDRDLVPMAPHRGVLAPDVAPIHRVTRHPRPGRGRMAHRGRRARRPGGPHEKTPRERHRSWPLGSGGCGDCHELRRERRFRFCGGASIPTRPRPASPRLRLGARLPLAP